MFNPYNFLESLHPERFFIIRHYLEHLFMLLFSVLVHCKKYKSRQDPSHGGLFQVGRQSLDCSGLRMPHGCSRRFLFPEVCITSVTIDCFNKLFGTAFCNSPHFAVEVVAFLCRNIIAEYDYDRKLSQFHLPCGRRTKG